MTIDVSAATLGDAVRTLLARECPPDVVRAAWTGDSAQAVWRRLAEAGVPAILVPEDAGGLGLDETHLVAVLVETGYAAAPVPTVETAAVAVPLLAGVPAYAELVAAVLAGDAVLSVATDPAAPVPYGALADAVLRLEPGRATLARPAHREPVPGIDGARRLARIDLSGGEPVPVSTVDITRAVARGTLASAAELVGLARRMLDLTVRYVTARRQFAVPVGSFQAVKHHLADALMAVEFAAPLVTRAAVALAAGTPDARRDVSMAKATASDAARTVAKLTLQCHGAMAYTTEYDHHLYAKRAWAQAATWGSAAHHRAVVAASLGLPSEEGNVS